MHTLLPIEITLPAVNTVEERIKDYVEALTANGFYADETANTVWFDEAHTAGMSFAKANSDHVAPTAIKITPDGSAGRGVQGTRWADGAYAKYKAILRIHHSKSEETCAVEFDFRNSYYPACPWLIVFSRDEKGEALVWLDDDSWENRAAVLLSIKRPGIVYATRNDDNSNKSARVNAYLDYTLLRLPSPENQCAMKELYTVYTQPAAYMNQIVRIGENNYRIVSTKKGTQAVNSGGFAFPVSDD